MFRANLVVDTRKRSVQIVQGTTGFDQFLLWWNRKIPDGLHYAGVVSIQACHGLSCSFDAFEWLNVSCTRCFALTFCCSESFCGRCNLETSVMSVSGHPYVSELLYRESISMFKVIHSTYRANRSFVYPRQTILRNTSYASFGGVEFLAMAGDVFVALWILKTTLNK